MALVIICGKSMYIAVFFLHFQDEGGVLDAFIQHII